ncbi:ATP-binding protein [Teichococcus vastitatis]|uniref:ATP-binding protein n=1 Tax=Teichococcus vastitatis TaxID=2307076 RepID=A0ABS9VYV7_9PROT|nr:ATP-binding protein [Pseudoroseomonas vastitatis]MCI0752152.1 ATP-binding protein [Pseudoroseomonas vastitatis]
MRKSAGQDYSIVALDKFIRATRDSGYKSTSSAVAELIDNALQARASEIAVSVTVGEASGDHPLLLSVVDNGSGMDARTLRNALRFGGSSRFNNRSGLGRYGMGLPNSSLSQAQRVTVHTWRSQRGQVLTSYLDIDEIASGDLTEVPEPVVAARPTFINGHPSGTAVTWSRCDRLDNRRISTLTRRLLPSLGRRFRYFLWNGLSLKINGEPVEPVDPLFLNPDSRFSGATQFGDELAIEVAANPDNRETAGVVRIRFSELPVESWSKLGNDEKRLRGISKGAGVSVVRGGREVDYGWFFLNGKRRENYDDWWRCEISFDPVLDEAFGITHTKQQIRPMPHLVEAIAPDIEASARALNARARKAHLAVKTAERFSASEGRATEKDVMLPPLPAGHRPRDEQVLGALGKTLPPPPVGADAQRKTEYRIVAKTLNETLFFNYARDDGRFVLVINPDHPFYRVIYKPLLDADTPAEATLRGHIDLLLLAAARTEALLEKQADLKLAEAIRKGWSDTLATLLNG